MIATPRDIDLILARVLAHSSPTAVYLFGSQGRGQAHPGSDIDLLIVEPSTIPRRLRGKTVTAALRGVAANFDLLFYTPEELVDELRNPLSFAATVTSGGCLIYAARDRVRR